MQFTNSLAWTRDPGRAFDELFNCVLQTIYLRGAPKAPTLCFSDRWLVAARAIMPLDSRGWPGRDRAACCCSNKLSGAAAARWRGGEGGRRHSPNAFGFSSLVKELSPSSSSSDTSTSSSCKPFFGSHVILFSFFSLLLALANQQLTWISRIWVSTGPSLLCVLWLLPGLMSFWKLSLAWSSPPWLDMDFSCVRWAKLWAWPWTPAWRSSWCRRGRTRRRIRRRRGRWCRTGSSPPWPPAPPPWSPRWASWAARARSPP